MFSKSFVLLALPLLAIASPFTARTDGSSCNTGEIQCCKSTQTANDPSTATLTGLLDIPIELITGLIGLSCSPITVIGGGAVNCNQSPVCCTNNTFNGLVALGCTPINIAL